MKNILVVVGLFFSTFLVAEEVLYCVPELSTGFIYENNTFKAGNFKKNRFTVKVYGDFEEIDYDFWKGVPCSGVGALRICVDKFGLGQTFKYDKSNGRFIAVYISRFGYLGFPSDDGGYDSDILQAGKCDKF